MGQETDCLNMVHKGSHSLAFAFLLISVGRKRCLPAMDAENDVPFLTNGMSHGNGVLEQVPSPIEEDIVLGKVNGVPAIGSDIAGPNGNPENVAKLEDGGTSNSSNEAEPDRITAREVFVVLLE
ncbi:hypothetical protein CsSME_00049047 [Camellia sinensis var. sinensis]